MDSAMAAGRTSEIDSFRWAQPHIAQRGASGKMSSSGRTGDASGFIGLGTALLATGIIHGIIIGRMADMIVGPKAEETHDGLDAASLEAARSEIRAGFSEGLSPLRDFVDSLDLLFRKVHTANERLKRKRGLLG